MFVYTIIEINLTLEECMSVLIMGGRYVCGDCAAQTNIKDFSSTWLQPIRNKDTGFVEQLVCMNCGQVINLISLDVNKEEPKG